METKQCSKCNQVKPLSDYGKHKNSKDGHAWRCNQCSREHSKKRRSSPDGVYDALKHRHGLKIKTVVISKEDFIAWYEAEPKVCAYCDIPEEYIIKAPSMYNRNITRLTIDCKDNGDRYESGNLALACLRCNFTKSNYFTFDEMRKIGQMFIKPKWKKELGIS